MSFVSLKDISKENFYHILKESFQVKKNLGSSRPILQGKNIGLLFEKPSTRTIVSFQVAIHQLGGNPIILDQNNMQLSRGESIGDTIQVLSRYLDGLVIRTHSHDLLQKLSSLVSIPIINALSDKHHPCQALADFMTILEEKNWNEPSNAEQIEEIDKISVCYMGDGSNNVCHSLMLASIHVPVELKIASPKEFQPDQNIIDFTLSQKANIIISEDLEEMVKNSHVLYTDTWTSMGKETEKEARKKILQPYQLNQRIVQLADESAIILHCLPAHKGEEITQEVFSSPKSRIFKQAENRLYTQIALLNFLYFQ